MFIVNNLNSIAVKDDFNGRWRSSSLGGTQDDKTVEG